jgi:dihydropteroate synthase
MFTWSSLCAHRPAVMGVVNVTPDSFSDGGRYLGADAAVAHGLELVGEGADVLDVGGESTRPGAAPITVDEELARVVPVVERLVRDGSAPVSIDTSKAAVAAAALGAGATVVNDVTAGRGDPAMLGVVADARAGFVAMHMRGEPRTMQHHVHYDNVVRDVTEHLRERLAAAVAAGVAPDAICVDPGIGFGKLAEHNLALLAHLGAVVEGVGAPVLVGASRKSFLGALLARARDDASSPDTVTPSDRDDATLATVMWSIDQGASVVRVHDVAPAVQCVRLWSVMRDLDAEAVA